MHGTGAFDHGTLRASHNNGSTLNHDEPPYELGTHAQGTNHH